MTTVYNYPNLIHVGGANKIFRNCYLRIFIVKTC